MTHGLYSDGTSLETKRAALDRREPWGTQFHGTKFRGVCRISRPAGFPDGPPRARMKLGRLP
jgi:hypothetical protein